MISYVISTPHCCAFTLVFLIVYSHCVTKYSIKKTCEYIIITLLSDKKAHINNVFGSHIVWVMMGMSGVQYSGSYGENVLDTKSTHALLVDNYIDFACLSAHNALNCSA